MARFRVKFNDGTKQEFTASKTLDEVNTMIADARTAGKFVKPAATLIINPETITRIEKID